MIDIKIISEKINAELRFEDEKRCLSFLKSFRKNNNVLKKSNWKTINVYDPLKMYRVKKKVPIIQTQFKIEITH